ncbi:MAG: hypothetical protein DMG67_00885 [Acidobacteria bacterium]|nr:MAG: hypothetical protein DMG67_00885 [Acidobacteriota bacterium]
MTLGLVAWERGDLDKAEEYYHQALTIKEKLAPKSLNVANTLNNLGLVAGARRDLGCFQTSVSRSLVLERRPRAVTCFQRAFPLSGTFSS